MKYINKSDSNVWVFLHQQFEVQAGKIAIFKITNDVSGDAIIFSPTSQTDFTNYSKFFFLEDVIANQDLPNGIIYVNKALYWSLEVYENTVYTTNLVNLQLLHSERVYVEPFAEECDCITTPIKVGSLNISDDPYDKDAWDGVTDIAPSKNAVRDVIETLTGASGGGGVWGSITGTLSDQTDLQTALNNKQDTEVGKGLSTNDLTNALKSNYDTAYSHTLLTNNPHSVTAAQVGLGNVDNTSDANKPISTAQATAFGKQRYSHFMRSPNFNPADNTNYYIQSLLNSFPAGVGVVDIPVPFACVFKDFAVFTTFSGAGGSNENITFKFVKNSVESHTIGTIKLDSVANAKGHFTGGNVSLVAGDKWEVKIEVPALATNPIGIIIHCYAFFEVTI